MLILAVLLSLLLSACFRRGDSLAPILTITEPRSGAFKNASDLVIRGYAMDDEGVRAIRVDGVDLLDYDIYNEEQGNKLIEFGFRTEQVSEGEWTVTLEAEDVSGRVTTLEYPVRIDSTKPTLTLSEVTPLGGGKIRVLGVAKDNNLLERVVVNEVELSIGKVSEYSFALDVETSDGTLNILVEDAAGNQLVETRTP